MSSKKQEAREPVISAEQASAIARQLVRIRLLHPDWDAAKAFSFVVDYVGLPHQFTTHEPVWLSQHVDAVIKDILQLLDSGGSRKLADLERRLVVLERTTEAATMAATRNQPLPYHPMMGPWMQRP